MSDLTDRLRGICDLDREYKEVIGAASRPDTKEIIAIGEAANRIDELEAIRALHIEMLSRVSAVISLTHPDALGYIPDTPDRQGWYVKDELISAIDNVLDQKHESPKSEKK